MGSAKKDSRKMIPLEVHSDRPIYISKPNFCERFELFNNRVGHAKLLTIQTEKQCNLYKYLSKTLEDTVSFVDKC